MYRIEISCNNNIKNQLILNYFNKYNLKTSKGKSFIKFKEILNLIINKQPLKKEEISIIRKLSKEINNFNNKNKSIGHKNKS